MLGCLSNTVSSQTLTDNSFNSTLCLPGLGHIYLICSSESLPLRCAGPSVWDTLPHRLQSRGGQCPACLAGEFMSVYILLCCCILMPTPLQWAAEHSPKITPSRKLRLRTEKCNTPRIINLAQKISLHSFESY